MLNMVLQNATLDSVTLALGLQTASLSSLSLSISIYTMEKTLLLTFVGTSDEAASTATPTVRLAFRTPPITLAAPATHPPWHTLSCLSTHVVAPVTRFTSLPKPFKQ